MLPGIISTMKPLDTKASSPALWHAWLMWGIAALFYAYEFCLKLSMTVMTPELMRDFQVDGQTLGILSSMYFFAYAAMQIPVGVLMDRYGARLQLTIAAMIVTIGCVVFAGAGDLFTAGIGRFMLGLGSAFAFVGCLKIGATWFPANRFAFIVGLTNTIGVLGVVLGEPYLSSLVQQYTWREAMFIASIFGAVCTVLLFLSLRDKREKHEKQTPSQRLAGSATRLRRGIITIIRRPRSWLVAFYAALMVAPIVGFAEQWSVAFLQDVFPIDKTRATSVSEIIFIGIGVGGLLHGWVSDHMNRRKPLMYSGAIGAFISMMTILYVPIPTVTLMGVALFCLGFFTSSMLLGFAVNCEVNMPSVRGTVVGFTNTLVMAGGALTQPLIGHLLDVYWAGEMLEGARHFTIYQFHIALGILPACQVLAFILLLFIRETYCQQQHRE